MLYFIDGARALNREVRESSGLATVVDRPRIREAMKGPGGNSGLVVVDESVTCEHRFDAERQTWEPRFGFPGTWVGVWNDRPVNPSELVRPKVFPGTSIKLLDGNVWTVPLLRQWKENDTSDETGLVDRVKYVFSCLLPTVMRQDQVTGRMVSGRVVKPYRAIWEESCELANDLLLQGQGIEVDIEQIRIDRFVGDLMSMNYRVGLPEMSLLGLVDETLHAEILCAGLDWGRLRELVKKNLMNENSFDSPSSNTESGETPPTEAETIPTGQPLEN